MWISRKYLPLVVEEKSYFLMFSTINVILSVRWSLLMYVPYLSLLPCPSAHCWESRSYPTLVHGLKKTSKYEITSQIGYEKNGNLNAQIERYFVIKIRPSPKMQKIIKLRSPSRQLSETVNFAFIIFFDFSVKIALLRASLLFFREICVMHFLPRVRLRP